VRIRSFWCAVRLVEEGRVEVGFGGFPVVGDFHEDGGDETQATGLVGEDGGDACSAADGFVESLAEIGSAQAFADGFREGEDGEALGKIGFHPGGQLWGAGGVFGDGDGELIAGRGQRVAGEDGADVSGDGGLHVLAWNVGLSVLLKMELAAVPRDGREDGGQGGFEALVGVAGDRT